MNYSLVFRILGMIVAFMGACMTAPIVVAILSDDEHGVQQFALSMVITLIGGGLLYGLSMLGSKNQKFRRREAFAVVTLGWVLCAGFGCLPFLLSQAIPRFIDAYFETMSGFTTTGASILTEIEAQTHAILFWRAMTHLFGGIGIVVLFVAILPALGVGGRELFFTEATGPIAEGIKPKIVQTARTLIKIYLFFIAVQTGLLLFGGMSLFEAVTHSFATMATGGFSTQNESITGFDSAYIEVVITIFMAIAGANFSLYYMASLRQFKSVATDVELRWYIGLNAVGIMIVTASLWLSGTYGSILESLRYGAFQIFAVSTTTGFASADFDQWPTLCKTILVLLMFVGGSAGSTAGGMKVIRLVVVWRHAMQEVVNAFRPNRVLVMKLGKRVLNSEVLDDITAYFVLNITIFALGTVFMSVYEGMDVVTAPTAVIACLFNIGPGLAALGPTQNFAWVPDSGKVLLIFLMILGRLEFYAVLSLFVPSFWKRN